MDQFFATLPKPVLAIGAIVIGFFVIILMNPPKTVCDSQLELFRQSQKEFLYPEAKVAGEKAPPEAKRLLETCKATNSPGGCFELFGSLKKLNADIENVQRQCTAEVMAEPPVKKWLFESLKLMVEIPWGSRGPASALQKNGWYDSSDLALFCSLTKSASRLMGDEEFKQWRETVMTELPSETPLERSQTWSRSMFSVGCRAYR
jgi:hypothetical protein